MSCSIFIYFNQILILRNNYYLFTAIQNIIIMPMLIYHSQVFEVPCDVSLEKLLLPVKIGKKMGKIKALDPHWIKTNRFYPSYVPYSFNPEDNLTYVNKNQRYLNELIILLSMSYHEFMCYMIYEPKISSMLDSFLKHGIPSYEFEKLNYVVKQFYLELYNNTIKVYLRMFDTDPDKIQFIERSSLLIYIIDNNIVHLGTLIDICRLYGNNNPKIVNQIMRYFLEEKQIIFAKLAKVFEYSIEKLDRIEDNMKIKHHAQQGKVFIKDALDILYTVSSFMEFCSRTEQYRWDLLFLRRAKIFFSTIPQFYQFIDSHEERIYKRYIKYIRLTICKIYFTINEHLIDDMARNSEKKMVEKVESDLKVYLDELYNSLSEIKFFNDFKTFYDVEGQFTRAVSIYTNSGGTGLEEDIQEINDALLGKPINSVKSEVNGVHDDGKAILTVKEALPHLGDDIIKSHLKKHNYDPELVVNALLEANLVSNSPEKSVSAVQPQPALSNVTKKKDFRDTLDLLEDKSFVKEMKQRNDDYSQYGVGLHGDSVDEYYNDDYDDTYDDHPVTIPEPKTELDEELWSQQNMNRFKKIDLSESSSEEDAQESISRPSNAFCEDPAVVRARRQAKYNERSRGDVVGRAKGEGQDQKVLNNRSNKNVHKSVRANHNRRGGAQWKRSRGMIPS